MLEYYENNPDFILPKSRKNEVVNFVKNGLKDLSVSRKSFSWGIKVPNNNKHIMILLIVSRTHACLCHTSPPAATRFSTRPGADAIVLGLLRQTKKVFTFMWGAPHPTPPESRPLPRPPEGPACSDLLFYLFLDFVSCTGEKIPGELSHRCKVN